MHMHLTDCKLQFTQYATIVLETTLRSLLLSAQATILRRRKDVTKSGLLPDPPCQSAAEVEENYKVGGSKCQSLLMPDTLSPN